MPEYLSPGVYVEEFEIGAKPIEGVGTSTAGFLGMTERGHLKPTPVPSFSDFLRKFGGYIPDSYTSYAVEGFFANGGQRCFIGRVVKNGAQKASLEEISPLTIDAVGPGSWGNRVAVRIINSSAGHEELFNLVVAYWGGSTPDFSEKGDTDEAKKKNLNSLLEKAQLVEVFENLSTDNSSADHFLKRINGISSLIEIKEPANKSRPANTDGFVMIPLENGTDGADKIVRDDLRGDPAKPPGEKTGLTAFKEVDEIAILNAPDSQYLEAGDQKQFFDDLLAHCEELKDRFAILEVPQGNKQIAELRISTPPLRPSKYGAVYYPWIWVYDPLIKRKKLLPPGGHIAGIYARSDQERGVHKAPANEQVRGALELEFKITKGEQDILNPRHINCIREFPGRGIMVWGARTMILDTLWKYINVRRLFIFIEESIDEGTQWVVFEPNNERLWGRVRATITAFLTTVWRTGALMGTKVEEAFFVRCDRTTMTQDDIDNGKLICVIGIAPTKPAEFVIFRITQWTAGTSIE